MSPARTTTCPFCGLLCDDLEVDPADPKRAPRNTCVRGRDAYESLAAADGTPQVSGRAVGLDAALDAVAALLRSARRPLIGGLDVDIAGMRATLDLARRLGAVVDHVSVAKQRNLRALQEFGAITTTFSEVRNRADLLLLVGDGWHRRFPRFIERMVAVESDLFGPPLRRRIVTLNPVGHDTKAALPHDAPHLALDVAPEQLPVLIGMLTAMIDDRPVEPRRWGLVAPALLERCVAWMREARYGIVVWTAADLEGPHAELTVQSITRCIRSLNGATRFAAMPLAGTDGDLTANAVQTWQSGVGLPACYGDGRVVADPERFALSAVLARGEADALIWVSSLGQAAIPAFDAGPTVVFGRADRRFDRAPDVFVPVATPGVDAAGHLVRGDKVVTLRLPAIRATDRPSVESALRGVLDRLGPPC